MNPRREKMPRMLESVGEIWQVKGRKPRKRKKPLCEKCENPLYVQKIDLGAKYKGKKRYLKTGWYCRNCKIFYYPDGSPDYRGVT